jgi:hypothetical protein
MIILLKASSFLMRRVVLVRSIQDGHKMGLRADPHAVALKRNKLTINKSTYYNKCGPIFLPSHRTKFRQEKKNFMA